MIQRRLTEFWKSVIFFVVIALSDNFTVRAQTVVLMVSNIAVAANDESEACDIIFQTGHLISRNLAKKNFHSKHSKILLT